MKKTLARVSRGAKIASTLPGRRKAIRYILVELLPEVSAWCGDFAVACVFRAYPVKTDTYYL